MKRNAERSERAGSFLRDFFHIHSLIRLFIYQAVIISLAIFGLLLAAFCYTYSLNRKATFDNTKTILSIYDESLSSSLKNDLYLLYRSVSASPDIISIGNEQSTVKYNQMISSIQNLLSSHLTLNMSDLSGAFVYLPELDEFIYYSNTSTYEVSSPYIYSKTLLADYFRGLHDADALASLDTSKWFVLRDPESGVFYLVRTILCQHTYTGTWYVLDELTNMDYMQNLGAYTSYITPEGTACSESFPEIDPDKILQSLEKPISVRTGDGMRCVLISLKLSYCGCFLSTLIPEKSFYPGFRPFWYLLALIAFCLFLFIFFISRVSSRILKLPEQTMQPILSSIEEGKYDFSEEVGNDYEETRSLSRAYRKMVIEIRKLETAVYEENLKKQDFELKYLKNQIAPHFLINCLNTIFVSAQLPDNQEVTGRLITTLTEHLRYTLTGQTTVSLTEEIRYLKNYLELTRFRFPGSLSYSFEVEESIEDATVFPLILLTLSENSIKTGLVMGEPYRITVRASAYSAGGRRWVHISHTDSGTGVSGELLHKFNHILHHFEVTEKGTGVGLYNTVSRLNLIFRGEAKIHFRNEEGMGLCVEYDIPYTSYFPYGDSDIFTKKEDS